MLSRVFKRVLGGGGSNIINTAFPIYPPDVPTFVDQHRKQHGKGTNLLKLINKLLHC